MVVFRPNQVWSRFEFHLNFKFNRAHSSVSLLPLSGACAAAALATACCHCSLMCCYRCLSTSSSHLTPPHVHVHLSGETKAATHATIASASGCCHCRACAQVLKHSSIHRPLHPLQRVFPFVHPCRRPATTPHRSAHQCVKWKYASSHPTSLQQVGRISTFPHQL
jgi:hypothetical protein